MIEDRQRAKCFENSTTTLDISKYLSYLEEDDDDNGGERK